MNWRMGEGGRGRREQKEGGGRVHRQAPLPLCPPHLPPSGLGRPAGLLTGVVAQPTQRAVEAGVVGLHDQADVGQ